MKDYPTYSFRIPLSHIHMLSGVNNYDVMRTSQPTPRVRCETRPLALLDLH